MPFVCPSLLKNHHTAFADGYQRFFAFFSIQLIRLPDDRKLAYRKNGPS
jgi:hypothetical protein